MISADTLLTVAMLIGYGLISGLTSAFIAVYLIRRRDVRTAAPKPRAANRNKQVSTPAHVPHPPELFLPIVYPEVTRLPASDGDVTEVRERTPDLTRYDLLHEHVERGIRARRDRAS